MTIREPVYKSTANGICYNNKNGSIIEISPRLFKKGVGYSRRVEATVFHELGHGILRRGHNDLYYDSAYLYIDEEKGYRIEQSKIWGKSLMTQPNSFKYWLNDQKREYYLRELFGLETLEQKGTTLKEYEKTSN